MSSDRISEERIAELREAVTDAQRRMNVLRVEIPAAELLALLDGYGLPWVSVADRLPDDKAWCWVLDADGEITEASKEGEGWVSAEGFFWEPDVTHWLPISAIPLPSDDGKNNGSV